MLEEQATEELLPSELGTKEYWNEAYLVEKKNFTDYGDVGEVWFGEDSAIRIVRWLCSSDLVKQDDSIIDLGCGNGMLLVELAREGFINLTGVDYSQNAIDLAESIMKTQNLTIRYEVHDILSTDNAIMSREYAVALDKGTYDAVSLHPEDSKEKREKYILNVWKLLKPQGLLVITSCNWTEKELILHFSTTCIYSDGMMHNQNDQILIDGRRDSIVRVLRGTNCDPNHCRMTEKYMNRHV